MTRHNKAIGTRQIKEFPVGSWVFTLAWMDGEFRETYYLIDPPRPCRYPENIPVGRKGLIQANPTAEELRYVRILETPCRDPGEIDGRTPVLLLELGVSHFYERYFKSRSNAQSTNETNALSNPPATSSPNPPK